MFVISFGKWPFSTIYDSRFQIKDKGIYHSSIPNYLRFDTWSGAISIVNKPYLEII